MTTKLNAAFFAAFLSLLLLSSISGFAQNTSYWQQEVDYKMDIQMDVKNHQYQGKQELKYTNNSPDTLSSVFYHLYFNAFQPGSEMDVRSLTIRDPDRRVADRISKLNPDRSEERRVGKECRSRWSTYNKKK